MALNSNKPIAISAKDLSSLFPVHGLLTVCTHGIWDRTHLNSMKVGTINISSGFEAALISECERGQLVYVGPFYLHALPTPDERLAFSCRESFFLAQVPKNELDFST